MSEAVDLAAASRLLAEAPKRSWPHKAQRGAAATKQALDLVTERTEIEPEFTEDLFYAVTSVARIGFPNGSKKMPAANHILILCVTEDAKDLV